VLAVLAHLEYRVWFALAEYIDNSIQSFIGAGDALARIAGDGKLLRIEIDIDTDSHRMSIRDNAAGISLKDFPRAFRPAELPPDRNGLCEFGMGMKSASCWFSPRWTVRTTALGEPIERRIEFDIQRIVTDQIEELAVEERPVPSEAHYTIVELFDVRNLPAGRTSGKIKEHLTDIYREFLRRGDVQIIYRGELLKYEEPPVLRARAFDNNNEPHGAPQVWKKQIEMDLGGGLSAHGFAALRATGSTKYAGFSLFRRSRVIQGSGEEKYRPAAIFGSPNTYVYQRLFGELHLEGFDVSHTKDGFQWDENEEPFLALLREHLDSSELPLIRQARNYREKISRPSVSRMAEAVTASTSEVLQHHLPGALSDLVSGPKEQSAPPESLPEVELASRRRIDVDFAEQRWRIVLELSVDEALEDWLAISGAVVADEDGEGRELLGVRMSLTHPFMRKLVKMDRDHVEPILRLAAGLALAEKVARDSGSSYPSSVRMNLNELLRLALSSVDDPVEDGPDDE
jgi:hypothetical protein